MNTVRDDLLVDLIDALRALGDTRSTRETIRARGRTRLLALQARYLRPSNNKERPA